MNAKTLNISRLLSPKEVSEILNVAESTLAIWRSVGRFELKFVKAGRKVGYRQEDVEEFIRKRTKIQTA